MTRTGQLNAEFAPMPYRNQSTSARVPLSQRENGCYLSSASLLLVAAILLTVVSPSLATPANKAALAKHYEKFLPAVVNKCTTCHLPSDNKAPESLEEFPHNPFGQRLREAGKELRAAEKKANIPARLIVVAHEDTDGDGTDNQTELLLGHNPGDAADKPSRKELAEARKRNGDFDKFITSYRWQPFEPVAQPPVPTVKHPRWVRNPIDAFIAAEHDARGLKPRPEASKEILLRRVYLDLLGLAPTPAELDAFLADRSPDAYEKVVDKLLADPRHGERWARHWMDVWRYSDWAGYGDQIRDSQPHIWRWRDWIVDSLNKNTGYDQMVVNMLAGDEIAPEDDDALRATGFLVRNYKLLSREQWLEDTVNHTSRAFLGLTVGCAKCHNHMFDPVSQREYYEMRAIFEPHRVRIDRLPGNADTAKLGLARTYDATNNAPTWFYIRGDERRPLTNSPVPPAVPVVLGGTFQPQPVTFPRAVYQPDTRPFVVEETLAAAGEAVTKAKTAVSKIATNASPDERAGIEAQPAIAGARLALLKQQLQLESLEAASRKDSADWKSLATETVQAQRELALLEAKQAVHQARHQNNLAQEKSDKAEKGEDKAAKEKATKELEAARKKLTEAEATLAKTEKAKSEPADTNYKPRAMANYEKTSTGRRLALARWMVDDRNPLAARVAVNHIWLRHFGQAIVPSVDDFGANGRAPTHPQLLDWLAAEFMKNGWQMKDLHRLMVTSSTYRQASTSDAANARKDPDNHFLWRMAPHRLEAEAVRDNLLYVSGQLDLTRGGPEIPQNQGLTSKRRSLYLRTAAEKEVEFLTIFDNASVTECYERKQSVKPQQALALSNSELSVNQARALAGELSAQPAASEESFIQAAFKRVLGREVSKKEMAQCRQFLGQQAARAPQPAAPVPVSNPPAKPAPPATPPEQRARENLILVLFNHTEFVTIR